jgi:predicted transcriptional regulator of viral defense system
MPTRLQIARPDVIKYFDSLPRTVLDRSDVERILQEQRGFRRLAQTTTVAGFIKFLEKSGQLHTARFDFSYRPIIKYTWGEVPLYTLLLSLKPGCYLTHYTAMYFHQLTDQVPKIININSEQAPKRRYASSQLDQGRIDLAFGNPTRMSNNTAKYEGHTIRMLNGLHTGNVGVIDMPGPEGETLRITDVERTLIDIAVRPEYSGGVFEVLEAYKRATDKVSINRLAAHLRSINYIYPYHQVIGFYLTKAGSYRRSQIDLLRRFEISYDFYLMHQIQERDYSKEWRLFYPKGLG